MATADPGAIYLVAGGASEEGNVAIAWRCSSSPPSFWRCTTFAFYRQETRLKLALETWVMIVFITWVVWYAGRIRSPLLNLYLLPVIASALILGKV